LEGPRDAWVSAKRPEWATVFASVERAREAASALKLSQSKYQITSRLQDFDNPTK
jgi:hypothetical protein